jgi:hypothetical protein
MKKSLRNTIMTEEMIVHEKIEEILKEQTLTLDDLNDISMPPNFDFEEVISTVKDYASKTKQNISDLIKNNSFVQSLKRYVSGDTTELSLDQESDREDIEQTEVYEVNPHIAKNTLDLQVVGIPSTVKISDYQLALIAYTLNLFAGKINSSLEKVESIIESKYKTSLKSAFKELCLEEKKYKKFSEDSHTEFINVCVNNQIILKNNGLYEIKNEKELFDFIVLSKGEYHTVSPMGYFIEKLVAISLNDKMEIKSFNIGEKFILCVMLILNNKGNKKDNQFIQNIEKIYKATKVNDVVRKYLKEVLSKTNIDHIKEIKINKFIESCSSILGNSNNHEIIYEDKTYDFIVSFKDRTSSQFQPFIFIDVKLKSTANNYFSRSRKKLISQIATAFGNDIDLSYRKIIDDGDINNNNKSEWDKLSNKKFINSLFHFDRSYDNFKIKTLNNEIKVVLNEDAFVIKYKLYNLQSLFYEVFTSNSRNNHYILEDSESFNINNTGKIKSQYDNIKPLENDKVKILKKILSEQGFSNEYYYDVFKEDLKSFSKSNSALIRFRFFFDAFRKKPDNVSHRDIFKKSHAEQQEYYRENWNKWYEDKKTQVYIKQQSVDLRVRYYFLNKFFNPVKGENPDRRFYTYILKKEEGELNDLFLEYFNHLLSHKNKNMFNKTNVYRGKLFQALFLENAIELLDKPFGSNMQLYKNRDIDCDTWSKFKEYLKKNKNSKEIEYSTKSIEANYINPEKVGRSHYKDLLKKINAVKNSSDINEKIKKQTKLKKWSKVDKKAKKVIINKFMNLKNSYEEQKISSITKHYSLMLDLTKIILENEKDKDSISMISKVKDDYAALKIIDILLDTSKSNEVQSQSIARVVENYINGKNKDKTIDKIEQSQVENVKLKKYVINKIRKHENKILDTNSFDRGSDKLLREVYRDLFREDQYTL